MRNPLHPTIAPPLINHCTILAKPVHFNIPKPFQNNSTPLAKHLHKLLQHPSHDHFNYSCETLAQLFCTTGVRNSPHPPTSRKKQPSQWQLTAAGAAASDRGWHVACACTRAYYWYPSPTTCQRLPASRATHNSGSPSPSLPPLLLLLLFLLLLLLPLPPLYAWQQCPRGA